MIVTKKTLFLTSFIAVVMTVGTLTLSQICARSVQANQGGRSSAQKWDYCAITNTTISGGGYSTRGVATIRYFSADGWKEETVDFVPDFGQKRYENRLYENGAIGKAMGKLGDEGWEMVSTITDKNDNISFVYFKRPRS